MAPSLDDDCVPANARVWDFMMPPKSCSTLPLSSENLGGYCGCIKSAGRCSGLCKRRFGVVAAVSAAES
jgi:hypothetical protein